MAKVLFYLYMLWLFALTPVFYLGLAISTLAVFMGEGERAASRYWLRAQ